MPQLALREWVDRAASLVTSRPRARRRVAAADAASGTVVLLFGRYFAARADMLTRDGFKTIVPIDGVSPFGGVGEPDPEMQHFADTERVNERAKTEVRKDLAVRLAQADAQFLVVDNSTALMYHREVNGRLYTVVGGEKTDLMDTLWNADPEQARAFAVKLSNDGFTDSLKSTYTSFVRACLGSFDPAKIILVRSHLPRFWVADDGTVAPTGVDLRDARFLETLDDFFIAQTGCRVAAGALSHFPSAVQWHTFDHRLRRVIEDDLVELCTTTRRSCDASTSRTGALEQAAPPELSAADHVVEALHYGHHVDHNWLTEYFAAGGASYDDLLALVYLEQRASGSDAELVRTSVRHALTDTASYPQSMTRQRFDRSLRALRRWRWCSLRLPRGELWTPQITVPGGSVTFRFHGDGSIQRVPVSRVTGADAGAIVEGRLPITPLNLTAVLGSWPIYLERGRRGITAAPRVVVTDSDELVDSCAWIDWAEVLDNERVAISTPDVEAVPARAPTAKTDLSFIFDPNTRVGTVGGGLADQLTHVALFDELCRPYGLDYYLDDLAFTWRRSHNGFEVSRLAPQLEARRISRLVSQALIESFRDEVTKTRLPWVFNHSRFWYEFGLPEATVVTAEHRGTQMLLDTGPEFPVLVYTEKSQLGELIRQPPSPICFYTTQHRIPIAPASAAVIRRVFSYHHLEDRGLDPEVARTAELLRSAPHIAFHVRRGDYVNPHFDVDGWHAQQSHYIEAMDYLIETELKTRDFDVAVFSDDLDFVEGHLSDYGLDRVTGEVRFIRGNNHYKSIFDSYLMSLCPIILGSVGNFAATTSLLADPPSLFIRAWPEGMRIELRR